MRKILELSSEALRTGRARSQYDDKGGIWDDAKGLNPYLASDTYRGLLAITATPTDLTGSVIVDIPVAYVIDERGSTNFAYVLGSSGHFYRITVNKAVSDLRSGTPIADASSGVTIIQPKAASAPTLFYFRATHIGSWDLSGTYATGWNDTLQAITNTPHHPVHPFFDRRYYGNKNSVGMIYDDGSSTPAHDVNALDFDKQETVTAINDDGHYLIVATAHLVDDSFNSRSFTRIVFWDTSASSWEWEMTIPNETAIRSIKHTPSGIVAVGENAEYQIAFGIEPKVVRTFPATESLPFDGLSYSNPAAACVYGDGVMFGKLGTVIAKPEPWADRIVFNPLQGHTGDISLLMPDFLDGVIFVGTRSSKLYWFNMASAGSSAHAQVTRYLDLGGRWHVGRVDVELPIGIGASDVTTIGMYANGGSIFKSLRAISQANFGSPNRVSLYLPGQITTSKVKLSITMSAGAPGLGPISIYGDPATAN